MATASSRGERSPNSDLTLGRTREEKEGRRRKRMGPRKERRGVARGG